MTLPTRHAARDYQQDLIDRVIAFWAAGGGNCLAVLPTGGGKTFVFAAITAMLNLAVTAIAHRSELVSQMSLAMAREGIRHRVIGPTALQKRCARDHIRVLGVSYVEPNSRVAVAGVDTLLRMPEADPIFLQTGLWITDEAHHLLVDNKWGKACLRFKNARGMGVTATPVRADGRGLGRHADGLIDEMFVGPTMRDLINRRFLTEYRIFAPPSDLDLSKVPTSASGEFSPIPLATARKASHITGDVVQHYLKIAPGKLGVTFDVDIEAATATAQAFNAAGVPALVVTSESTDDYRTNALERFARQDIKQLVNVDLFGEGFDLPAIEVVSMARPTQSYSLFAQQFGRSLRIMEGKSHAIIIDHVGNTLRHGLPDAPRTWSLDRRERKSKSVLTDVIPTRACPSCTGVYERAYVACPYCSFQPISLDRSAPEQVDGDLWELDEATLRRLRGDVASIDGSAYPPRGATPEIVGAVHKRHAERQQGQHDLRHLMSVYGGWQAHLGRDTREAHRRFYFQFGVDVASAQTLGFREAEQLAERINAVLTANNVVER